MTPQREFLRIAAGVGREYSSGAATAAIHEVLGWSCGGERGLLPDEAWKNEPFRFSSDSGHLRCEVVQTLGSEPDGNKEIWAIRVRRRESAGRGGCCTTEAAVCHEAGHRTRLTVRQLRSTRSNRSAPPPATPGFVRAVDRNQGLYFPVSERFWSRPWTIESHEDFQRFVHVLLDGTRTWPIFVLTTPEDPFDPTVERMDAEQLALDTAGLARVVVLPSEFSWELTHRFGKELSVFWGAVRVYRPGFGDDVSPEEHELILPDRLRNKGGAAHVASRLQWTAARCSLDRFGLAADLVSFEDLLDSQDPPAPPSPHGETSTAVLPAPDSDGPGPAEPAQVEGRLPPPPLTLPARDAVSSAQPGADGGKKGTREDGAATPGAGMPLKTSILGRLVRWILSPWRVWERIRDQNRGLRKRISKLETDRDEWRELAETTDKELEEAKEARKQTETRLEAATEQIGQLESEVSRLRERAKYAPPDTWGREFVEWTEDTLAGKLVLSDRAQRSIKKPKFRNVGMAVSGLQWLAGEYREQRIIGGRDPRGPTSIGLTNARCGASRFAIEWGGRKQFADWHLKNGGNTHDPTRCLRIYYFWDDSRQLVVVADMPAHHRVTGR